jgi:hypothetical protein
MTHKQKTKRKIAERNWTVQHVMKKSVRKHKNKKRQKVLDGDKHEE